MTGWIDTLMKKLLVLKAWVWFLFWRFEKDTSGSMAN